MKEIDFYSVYSTDGVEALTEKLKSIKEELHNAEAPDFTKEQSEESEEESEEENWGDEVDL